MLCHICQLTFRGQRERSQHTDASAFPYHLISQLTLGGERERPEDAEPSSPIQAYNHHQSSLHVQAAASKGCHLCTVLWAMLSVEERSQTIGHGQNTKDQLQLERDHVQIKVVPTTLPDTGRVSLQIAFPLEIPINSDDTWSGRFCIKSLELLPADEIGDLTSRDEISASTVSEANFALANKWLNDCLVKHSICRRLDEMLRQWYPTRLLDVGQPGTDVCEVRLRICETDLPSGPYLSLSHCWGSALLLKLTTENMELMKAGLPFRALPKTFQDAVLITRQLNVRFLWIDALCIIQDSVEDWRKEVVTMGNVYKNALCNIAATGAQDSSIGCFWDRNPLLVQPCKLDFTWGLPIKGSYYCFDGSLWPKNIGEAPLNRRAWVTQERILSPRVLHFGMQQIFWECHELEACESFPSGIPKTPDPMTFIVRTGLKRMQSAVRQDAHSIGSESLADPYLDGYDYWDGILDVYTRSSLTRPEDKLIALSGLAKEMSILLNDEYLAGLWKKRLASQLLWSVNRPAVSNNGQPSFRPQVYRAPTWSWASVDGHIMTGNRASDSHWQLLPSLLEIHLTPVGTDRTGQVSGGHLQAQGFLRSATWQCRWTGRIYALLLDGKPSDYSTFWPDEIFSLPEGEVYCFPMLDKYTADTRTVDGLVLAKNAGKGSSEYRRIGNFRYQDEEDCWLLMKRQRSRSSESENPVYDPLEEQSFTIV